MACLLRDRCRFVPFLSLLTPLIAGCPGEANIPGGPVGRQISFADEIQPIFNTHCISCHSDGSFASIVGVDMRLTEGQAHGSIVDQPSSQNSSFTLIAPGDSDSSLLFLKVSSNDPPVGSTMPLIGQPLSSGDLALLRDWIDQGALDN